jgi:cobalamin biosynthesis protein CobC
MSTVMASSMAFSAALLHGGDLTAARHAFPDAPQPFVDLSTGINPFAYPMPELKSDVFTRLPEHAALVKLATAAAGAYGLPSAACVAAGPGTQILLAHVFSLIPPGRAAVLGPTYAEHARVAALIGHDAKEVGDVAALKEANLAIVVNPNNPDGRLVERQDLLALAETLRRWDGLLVVDEAFMDVGPVSTSLVGDVARGNIVVLRSFGKFFGLAGVRLGFALAAPGTAERLRLSLGPWAISGAALAVGTAALADQDWIDTTRVRLATASMRLDALLHEARLTIIGGTSLFHTVRSPHATEIYHRLGSAGVLVRHFPERPQMLRFGLPGADADWERLRAALAYDIDKQSAVTPEKSPEEAEPPKTQ